MKEALHAVRVHIDAAGRVQQAGGGGLVLPSGSCQAVLIVGEPDAPSAGWQPLAAWVTLNADGELIAADSDLTRQAARGYLVLPAHQHLTPDQEAKVSDRFRFLWEQYTKVVNLTITLITGTLLLFLNLAFNERTADRISRLNALPLYCGYASVLMFLLALVSAVAWRVLSQAYMEKEVFGKADLVRQYLVEAGVADDYQYAFEQPRNSRHRRAWLISRFGTYCFLAFGWLMCVIFFLGLIMVKSGP
jgi:hypothetical protein